MAFILTPVGHVEDLVGRFHLCFCLTFLPSLSRYLYCLSLITQYFQFWLEIISKQHHKAPFSLLIITMFGWFPTSLDEAALPWKKILLSFPASCVWCVINMTHDHTEIEITLLYSCIEKVAVWSGRVYGGTCTNSALIPRQHSDIFFSENRNTALLFFSPTSV